MSVYISSDWHGRYDLWEKVKNFLKPEDKLIYLGDAIDRGPRGWDLLIDLLLDERVTFIKGNHEDLFETYMTVEEKDKTQALTDWVKNGGSDTIKNIIDNGLTLQSDVVQCLIGLLKTLPTEGTYINKNGQEIIYTHAGFTPGKSWDKRNGSEKYWDSIWDRKHITNKWSKNKKYKNTYIVHGHTPCPAFATYGITDVGYGPISYCNDHKIDLDMSTVYSNQLCLFDADTFQVYVFSTKEGDSEQCF